MFPCPPSTPPVLTRGTTQGSPESVGCGDSARCYPHAPALPTAGELLPTLCETLSGVKTSISPEVSLRLPRFKRFWSCNESVLEERHCFFANPAVPKPACPADARGISQPWRVQEHRWERVSAGNETPSPGSCKADPLFGKKCSFVSRFTKQRRAAGEI